MTTILNGTEFVAAPAAPRRAPAAKTTRPGIAVRRDARRNRRAIRAI
jgi:hypothetical protein